MAKRGRPLKENARRQDLNIRLTDEESNMLKELSEKTGKCRTDLIVEAVRAVFDNSK